MACHRGSAAGEDAAGAQDEHQPALDGSEPTIMSTKIPDALKADMPQTTWGRILVATPVVMTVVATLLAGLASSEMTRAQYNLAATPSTPASFTTTAVVTVSDLSSGSSPAAEASLVRSH